MRKLIYCALAASLFVMTSCQKEDIQPTEINSTSDNLIIEGNNKVDTDSLTITNPFGGTNPMLGTNTITTSNTGSTTNGVDVVTYLKDNSEFSLFYSALFKTGMVDQVDTDGPFTIFAPNNQAIQTFLANNNWNTIDDVPVNILTLVVKFHISESEVTIGDLTNGMNVTILFNDKNVYINMDDPNHPFVVLGLTSANVMESDMVQTNGVIHHIDGVLSL